MTSYPAEGNGNAYAPPLPVTGAGNGVPSRRRYDAVVIGSGFGGSMAAHALVQGGLRVLLIERGPWVPRGPGNWDPWRGWQGRPGYQPATGLRVRGERRAPLGAFHCVGGSSVYYGGVSFRFRPDDFVAAPSIVRGSGAAWPFGYDELAPWYTGAERLLGIAGDESNDPTAPPRDAPLPAPGLELSPTSRALRDAAARLGLRPFRLPMALHDGSDPDRPACRACGTCDGFACAIGAKNDMATAVLPRLLPRGLELVTGATAVGLHRRGDRIRSVTCVVPGDDRTFEVEGEHVVVAAGALATPQLLLGSGLAAQSPAAEAVGRYLMRHCNGIAFGLFPSLGTGDEFRKQIAVHDFYFGHPSLPVPMEKLGGIQQVHAMPIGLAQARIPRWSKRAITPLTDHVAGLLVIAEDQPRAENAVELDPRRRDGVGLPGATVTYRHSPRDVRVRRILWGRAGEILREAGAVGTQRIRIRTFSHALGTVRMGDDPASAPLDRDGRFRGLRNLWITDGSALPTSGAVNPSLTIAANALRIASVLAGEASGAASGTASGNGGAAVAGREGG